MSADDTRSGCEVNAEATRSTLSDSRTWPFAPMEIRDASDGSLRFNISDLTITVIRYQKTTAPYITVCKCIVAFVGTPHSWRLTKNGQGRALVVHAFLKNAAGGVVFTHYMNQYEWQNCPVSQKAISSSSPEFEDVFDQIQSASVFVPDTWWGAC